MAKRKEPRMTLRVKGNETSEFGTNSIKSHSEAASAYHAPSHEEIRRRAYEIYLERNGVGGNELDDWLQAEMELVSDALLARSTKETKRRA
jgi:hypothetical protein